MEHRPSDGNNLTPHGGTASAAGGGKKSATRKSDQTRCHTTGQYGKSRNVTAPSHCGFFCNRNNTRGGLLCHDRNKQVHTGPYKLCPPPVRRKQKAAGKRAFSEGVKKIPIDRCTNHAVQTMRADEERNTKPPASHPIAKVHTASNRNGIAVFQSADTI